MPALDNLPDRCTIIIRQQKVDFDSNPLGGRGEQDNIVGVEIECWLQPLNTREIVQFGKRNQHVSHKIYFNLDHGITENHKIIVTHRAGVPVANPPTMDVQSGDDPDSSMGFGYLWKYILGDTTGTR